MSDGAVVGDAWLAAWVDRVGGRLSAADTDAGLLASMAGLDGPGFSAADVDPLVRDFYEHTAGWRMEAWAGWSPAFWPGGELVSRLFGRRVQQLALPMRPLDVAHRLEVGSGRMARTSWWRTAAEPSRPGCRCTRRSACTSTPPAPCAPITTSGCGTRPPCGSTTSWSP